MNWKPSDRTKTLWDVFSSACLAMMLGMLQGGRVEDYDKKAFSSNGTRLRTDIWPYDHSQDSKGMYENSMYHGMYEDR